MGWLRKRGCLQEIKPGRLRDLAKEGMILVTCSDGHYSRDIFQHLGEYADRIHMLGLNGGAINLSPLNPHYQKDGLVLINNIQEAWELGKGRVIVLLSHFNCGRAGKLGYSVQRVITDTLLGDDNLVQSMGVDKNVVLPLLHVDWQLPVGNKWRTYIIKNNFRKLI